MAAERERLSKCRASHSVLASRIFAILIVVCLVECASGSCLSYGHSCWGAHGKRSGKPPATAPDWYLSRMLRRMAANTEMNNANHAPARNDLSAIFQGLSGEDTQPNNQLVDNDERPMDLPMRGIDAKPMLDEDMISKFKLWQVMKDSSDEK